MPNFVRVDSKPFHRDTYIGPEQDEEAESSLPKAPEERDMGIKLRVENTIRWRWVKDDYGEDVSVVFVILSFTFLMYTFPFHLRSDVNPMLASSNGRTAP